AVELADDVLPPIGDLLPAGEVDDRAAGELVPGVDTGDLHDRRRQVQQGDEGVGTADGRDPGDLRDEGHVVDVVVHRRALVVHPVRPGELPVIGGEQHGRVLEDPELPGGIEDPADLEVDHRHVAAVDGDQLLPLLRGEGGGGPVCR